MDSESGGEVVITARNQWTVNGENVGTFEPASIIASLQGIGGIDPTQLNGKTIRQIGPDQKNVKGTDVSGFIVLADVGAALLFDDPNSARRWANNPKQVNIDTAPSLTYAPSGHSSVSLIELTSNLYS